MLCQSLECRINDEGDLSVMRRWLPIGFSMQPMSGLIVVTQVSGVTLTSQIFEFLSSLSPQADHTSLFEIFSC